MMTLNDLLHVVDDDARITVFEQYRVHPEQITFETLEKAVWKIELSVEDGITGYDVYIEH